MKKRNILTKKAVVIFLLLVLAISFFSPSVIAQEGSASGSFGSPAEEPTPEELEAINDAVTRFVNGVATQADMDLIDQHKVDIRLPDEQGNDPQSTGQANDNAINDKTATVQSGNNLYQIYFNIGIALVLVIVLIMQFYIIFKKS